MLRPRGSLWQDRHSRLSEMQVCISGLPCTDLRCLASCCLFWAGLALPVLLPFTCSVLLCPIGNYGQCAARVHKTADITVDASCQLCAYFQHQSVNICSTVLLAWLEPSCCNCFTRVILQKATVAAFLYDAAHEATAFVMWLCASKCSSRVVATFHESDLWLFDAVSALSVANLPLSILCFCRKSSIIVIADIASTSLVMLWLMYIIHVTLRENQEDAQNIPQPARISEILKVNALYHHCSLLQCDLPHSAMLCHHT
jgi:hypothetical protein